MKLNKIILPMCILYLLASCGNYLEIKNPKSLEENSNQTSLSPGFLSIKESILNPHCLKCHQQYNTYQGVIREISAIEDAVTSNRMPKSSSPLSQNQKNLLKLWIVKGTPERAGQPNEIANPTPLEANWKSVSENIIFPKCLVCHNPQGQAKFLDLSNRQIIFDQRNRVFGSESQFIDFDSPSTSYLIQILLDEVEPMPPRWSNISRLNEQELQVLTNWIQLGIP